MYFGGRQKTRVLIVNDNQDCGASYTPLFSSLGEVTHDPAALKLDPLRFKLVVFTGGADVSPSLYGDTSPKGICHSNPERDSEEKSIFHFTRQHGIKMVGICRGMQFLNVMTGGRMMHDLSGHSGGAHKVMTRDRDEPFLTNSFHHQMCIPHKESHILAWSNTKLSNRYIGEGDEPMDYKGPEVEAFYNSFDRVLGVQWHPEATPASGEWLAATSWFNHMVRDIIDKVPHEFKKLYCGRDYVDIFVREAS